MQNRTPAAPNAGAPLPAFEPVPRKCARHDGWTPARQRAFIEALADTGSVSRAAAQVNMSAEGAYYLRRQPGATSFRAAWEAALDYGVARMKDIAFERAITGYLVPIITGGKLIGYRRIYNDRLLMFCLRHYGQDANGRRTRVEYFSTRATAGASGAPSGKQQAGTATLISAKDASPDRPAAGPDAIRAEPFDVTDSLRDSSAASGSFAEASTTTVRTVITGGTAGAAPHLDRSTASIDSFDPALLDDSAREAIAEILADCAARRRADLGTIDDPAEVFTPILEPLPEPKDWEPLAGDPDAPGRTRADGVSPDEFLEHDPRGLTDESPQYRASDAEMPWTILDDEDGMTAIEDAVRQIAASKAKGACAPLGLGQESEHRSIAGGNARRVGSSGQPGRSDRTDVEAGFTPAEPPSEPSPKPKRSRKK